MWTFTSRILRSLCVVGLVLMTLISVGGAHASAAAPPSAPWGKFTTSPNTDPRVDLVTVASTAEGGTFIAVCSGSTLYKGFTAQEVGDPAFTLKSYSHARECLVSGETPATPVAEGQELTQVRVINTDPQLGWAVSPTGAAPGSGAPMSIGAACSGTTGVLFSLVGGAPSVQYYRGACTAPSLI